MLQTHKMFKMSKNKTRIEIRKIIVITEIMMMMFIENLISIFGEVKLKTSFL